MIQIDDKYLKDLKLNGSSINRIYNDGSIYWGNVIAHTPSEWHGIRGTANVVSVTLNNAIYYNDTYHNVNVDKNGNWEIEENNPIYTAQGVCRNNTITSIDFTKVIWQPITSRPADGWGTLDLLFKRNTSGTSGLTDVYFDFTGQDSEHMIGVSQFFGTLTNCRCHGLGTLKWSGEINITDSTRPYKAFGLRELSNNLIGTFDIRGIDTTSITDQDQTYMDWLRTTWGYGLWYNFGIGLNCDTWIVGKFEIQSGNSMSFSYPSRNVKTLYCTSQIPPSLNRTGLTGTQCYDWLSQLSSLTNIYVPTGCLSSYQNASGWSNKASIMSEREAQDPLNI